MKLKANLKSALAGTVLAALPVCGAVPEVSNVTMTQNETSRRVKITYDLSGAAVVTVDIQTNATANGETVWASIGGAAVGSATGDVWKRVEAGGRHVIRWQPDLAWPGHRIDEGGARAVVTAWALDNTPDYMVVDISEGAKPNSQKYYSSADSLPGGLLGNDDYRLSKLVLRKVMAKDVEWTMGSTEVEAQRDQWREATHLVTLTNNYYIGVFPVTQSQFGLVGKGLATAYFMQEGAMRPMDSVCYNILRQADTGDQTESYVRGYSWPHAPNPVSFLGRLRQRTGLDFDLPSEAQWEFAARAGHGSGSWGDGSPILNSDSDANLDRLGSYARTDEQGTTVVGTFAPNDWGIYDMQGNVWEWCLDWAEDDISGLGGAVNVDPANGLNLLSGGAGEKRVMRGGCYAEKAWYGRPACRLAVTPWDTWRIRGVRVVCTAGLK